MDEKTTQLILDELFSSLENLETQSAAIMQFLKEKGGASDEQLAPYLEQAGRASSIKRRAARVRLDYLLSGIMKPPKEASEQDAAQSGKKSVEAETREGKTQEKAQEKDESGRQENATETEAGQKSESTTEQRPKDQEHRQEALADNARKTEGPAIKASADPGKEPERKDKPEEPKAKERKTNEKAGSVERSEEKRAAKSSGNK